MPNDPAPQHAPPPVQLVHDDGRRLRLLGDPEDQLALATRLSPAGFHLVDPETTTAPQSSKQRTRRGHPDDAMLAIPTGTPPEVFARALGTLGQEQPANTDLLHPVARAGDLGLPDTHRFAVTGYSGHGNMLLQAVLRAIDQTLQGPNDQRPRPPQIQRLCAEADHHSHALRAACVELFRDIAASNNTVFNDYVIAPGQLADCIARARFADGQTLQLGGLPHAGFLGMDFGAHTFWNDRAARFFPHFGYRRVYFIVRDPLAGLASNAAKTQRPLERVLHDKDWFTHTAQETAAYLQAADACREHFTLIRFEDLLHQPIATIQQLARDANGKLSDEQAQTIWDAVGFKPVTAAGAEHLVDPLADKRKHFRRTHLNLMEQAGLLPWFERFGYPPPNPDDLQDTPLDPQHANANDTPPGTPSTLYGRLNPVTLHRASVPNSTLLVRATTSALCKATQKTLKKHPFQLMARSLGNAFNEGQTNPPRLVS